MPTKIAVNLPVEDLTRSARFSAGLGFPSAPQLTTENTGAASRQPRTDAPGRGPARQNRVRARARPHSRLVPTPALS
jgi:hypothetical protein